MHTNTKKQLTILAVVLVATLILTAAIITVAQRRRDSGAKGTHRADTSRSDIYDSLNDMDDATDVVVTGEVRSQKTAYDIDDITAFTLAQVYVSSVEKGEIEQNKSITVRLSGTTEQSPLKNGAKYAFFLVHSGLEGALATQYYVTGSTAGIYEIAGREDRSETVRNLVRVDKGSGDTLPETLSLSDLEAAID